MMQDTGSTKTIMIALLSNLGVAVSKLLAALFTGSASMLAEAIHSFSDCGNQLLLLHGKKLSAEPPSRKYPLGRGKEMFFWAFVVALMLFSLGGLFSIYEGLDKLENPTPVESPLVGLIVLLVAMVLEYISLRATIKSARQDPVFKSFPQWVKYTSRADLLVLFLEDSAAMLGLVLALITLGLAWTTGNSMWDALGSVAVGGLLVIVAVLLASQVKSLLIGEAPVKNYEQPISEILSATIKDASILSIIGIQHGVQSVIMAYKINIGSSTLTAREAAVLVNEFESKVVAKFPEIKWQFSEIDVKSH